MVSPKNAHLIEALYRTLNFHETIEDPDHPLLVNLFQLLHNRQGDKREEKEGVKREITLTGHEVQVTLESGYTDI